MFLPPVEAMQETCKRARKGLDTISVTGNVLRYLCSGIAVAVLSGALSIMMHPYQMAPPFSVFTQPPHCPLDHVTWSMTSGHPPFWLISISGDPCMNMHVHRDYLTDLFPILELGTSAKVKK